MNRVAEINFKKIQRISPSQFFYMKNCSYKSILGEVFERKPLLPISPNAYFGTVLHKMLELISKGIIKNESDFNNNFEEQLKIIEDKLRKEGYEYFIPLQINVKDFGIKKILLKKHLRTVTVSTKLSKSGNYLSEKWFESKDGLIGGYIDLVIECGQEVEIVDFKTGEITQDNLDDCGEIFIEIKKEYQEQLKLYAYLYFESTGKFPNRLSIIDLAKQKFNIEFTMEECKLIYDEAKLLLIETNNNIESKHFAAKPNEINCKYCLYRPACSFYLDILTPKESFNDICGSIKNITQYKNGNVTVFLENGNSTISVTGFSKEYYDYFSQNIKKNISIFNLKREASEVVYSTKKITTVYEL